MPTLNLFTNVPVDAVVASDILRDATKAIAKIIGKPESYVMILLNGSVPIAFAGTEAPAAYGELISIGGLGQSVNGKLSSTVAEILQTKLSIDGSRFYIKFYDVEAEKTSVLSTLINRTNAQELKRIVMIILKGNLKLVCERLRDRSQRHKRQLHGKEVIVECKFDGDRIQIHKNGTEVHFFSRSFLDHSEYEHGMLDIIVQSILVDRMGFTC
ncbi:hypothetical protein CDL15_Pgr027045 [Punica granatum]|uniref:L-dopachrome isomerase n=2 Tax=Punica granatum TaxID=22663 RepID=A0A218XHS2_PUNGR|nr:hypothetical protein CDL15_Pgr027045 [Punica granatum]